jgi:hypothetical protein
MNIVLMSRYMVFHNAAHYRDILITYVNIQMLFHESLNIIIVQCIYYI